MRLTGSGSGSGVGANENSPFPEAGPQGRSFIQSPGTRPAPRAPPRPWVQGVSPIFPHHLEVGPQGRPFMYRPGRQPGDQQWCWAPVPGFAPWDWHGRASLRSGLCRLGVPGSHGSRRGLWMDGPSTDEGLGTGSALRQAQGRGTATISLPAASRCGRRPGISRHPRRAFAPFHRTGLPTGSPAD